MSKTDLTMENEKVLTGLGVSPGIAIGNAMMREGHAVTVPEYCIWEDGIDREIERFHEAVELTRRQIRLLKRKAGNLPETASEELSILLDAYVQMLEGSRLVRGVERRIKQDRINAELAVQSELNDISSSFAALEDAYIAARLDDIREVAHRLIRALMRSPQTPFADVPQGAIIVAAEMTPADTAQIDPSRVAAFTTATGGAQGHTAIMARALGMPAVLGIKNLTREVESGDVIIVDGDEGRVVINPNAATLAEFEKRREEIGRRHAKLAKLRNKPAETRDGTVVTLLANLELPIELEGAVSSGAEGIGLLRSEFAYMNRADLPGEEEQYQLYRTMIEKMDGKPVTIRTLDIGGEKIATSLLGDYGESLNSALGLRGIRLSLKQTKLIETQAAAILRAAAHGPVRILLPMITSVIEIRRAKDLFTKVHARLVEQGRDVPAALPPIGIMIEVPGTALTADSLAANCDFFAIGSNDLTMYALAADRTDDQVAKLYDPLHPAVLRLIQFSVSAANRAGISVSICGEIAGDPRFTAILLGLGLRRFSMATPKIPVVKQRIRSMDLQAAERRAAMIMEQMDPIRIAMLVDDFNALAS